MTRLDIDPQIVERETRRLCRRYIDEIVLPYSLCPWAAPALQSGRVQMHVIAQQFSESSDFDVAARCVLDALEHTPDEVELALVLFPLCAYSRLEMDDLLRSIRQLTRPTGVSSTEAAASKQSEIEFALAAFHPDAPLDTTTPERFIPFLRRSPDPMIQAVRTSVLSKIDTDRGSGTAFFDADKLDFSLLEGPLPKSLRLRVAEANWETCRQRLGELEERYQDILLDRRLVREAWSS